MGRAIHAPASETNPRDIGMMKRFLTFLWEDTTNPLTKRIPTPAAIK